MLHNTLLTVDLFEAPLGGKGSVHERIPSHKVQPLATHGLPLVQPLVLRSLSSSDSFSDCTKDYTCVTVWHPSWVPL